MGRKTVENVCCWCVYFKAMADYLYNPLFDGIQWPALTWCQSWSHCQIVLYVNSSAKTDMVNKIHSAISLLRSCSWLNDSLRVANKFLAVLADANVASVITHVDWTYIYNVLWRTFDLHLDVQLNKITNVLPKVLHNKATLNQLNTSKRLGRC